MVLKWNTYVWIPTYGIQMNTYFYECIWNAYGIPMESLRMPMEPLCTYGYLRMPMEPLCTYGYVRIPMESLRMTGTPVKPLCTYGYLRNPYEYLWNPYVPTGTYGTPTNTYGMATKCLCIPTEFLWIPTEYLWNTYGNLGTSMEFLYLRNLWAPRNSTYGISMNQYVLMDLSTRTYGIRW